jgi:hypothetical protein
VEKRGLGDFAGLKGVKHRLEAARDHLKPEQAGLTRNPRFPNQSDGRLLSLSERMKVGDEDDVSTLNVRHELIF